MRGTTTITDLIVTAALDGHQASVRRPGELDLYSCASEVAVLVGVAVGQVIASRAAPQEPEDHDVMKVPELAKCLRVRPHTIYAAIRAGEIPGAKRVGRLLRIDRASVERWMQSQDKKGARR